MSNSTSTALPALLSQRTSATDSSSVLYIGVCLALLSSVSQIGKGLQKLGVDTLPELTLTTRTIKKYLGTRTWLLGVGLDICGALPVVVARTRYVDVAVRRDGGRPLEVDCQG